MMRCFASDANEPGPASPVRFGVRPSSFILRALLLAGLAASPSRAADTNGPTIRLSYEGKETAANTVAEFMYFVPLISPGPVSSLTSPDSTQSVRILSAKRRFSTHSFEVTCEADLSGDGWQQSVFDLTSTSHRRKRRSQKGGSLGRHLKSIDVHGAGAITVEVEGALSNDVATVREVRLRFNAHGHASPVWIEMCDIRLVNGDLQPANEILARVNTLTFRRRPGPPTMEVTVASLKHKESGNGFWQNFKGRLAGVAVNMFIDPLTVEAAGNQAMLDFGQALVAGAPTFTFPRAPNLQANNVP